jgi:hypothetical protein
MFDAPEGAEGLLEERMARGIQPAGHETDAAARSFRTVKRGGEHPRTV